MYEEVLAPWTERFEQAFTTQLVPRVYRGEERLAVRILQPVPIVDRDAGGVLDGGVNALGHRLAGQAPGDRACGGTHSRPYSRPDWTGYRSHGCSGGGTRG